MCHSTPCSPHPVHARLARLGQGGHHPPHQPPEGGGGIVGGLRRGQIRTGRSWQLPSAKHHGIVNCGRVSPPQLPQPHLEALVDLHLKHLKLRALVCNTTR